MPGNIRAPEPLSQSELEVSEIGMSACLAFRADDG